MIPTDANGLVNTALHGFAPTDEARDELKSDELLETLELLQLPFVGEEKSKDCSTRHHLLIQFVSGPTAECNSNTEDPFSSSVSRDRTQMSLRQFYKFHSAKNDSVKSLQSIDLFSDSTDELPLELAPQQMPLPLFPEDFAETRRSISWGIAVIRRTPQQQPSGRTTKQTVD